jgi:5-methyltetrahydropteroyltriglutamate--homocysteine methyltransferase
MPIPTEPIGSIPRPPQLLSAAFDLSVGRISLEQFQSAQDSALRDTISLFEETGSPVITDGEQTKSSFATYPLSGFNNLAPDGVVIPFADGHTRQLPKLTAGPFRYSGHAAAYLNAARRYTQRPLKQAVISASALSLLYPPEGIPNYPRADFLNDLTNEAVRDIRECLDAGAHNVQIDFTEARLALKLDPSSGLLDSFINLNNRVLARFSDADRVRIGVHTCPGGDRDSTHSADVEYTKLLPLLFELNVGRFYIQLASERDRVKVLETAARHLRSGQILFIGVTDPINSAVETPEQVRDRILEAAAIIPVESLGTTDDCGFSPFADDTSTSRETAFSKIRSRVEGTRLADAALGI